MDSSLKILIKSLLVLMVAGVLGATVFAGWVYWESERQLNRVYNIPLEPIAVPEGDPEAIAEGAVLAKLNGCVWCHRERLQGMLYWVSERKGIALYAPSLPRKAASYSNEELARAIRMGVRQNGTGLHIAMPGYGMYHLSDEDLGKIIAYIRSMPDPDDGFDGGLTLWPYGRWRLVSGDLPKMLPEYMPYDTPRVPDPGAEDPVGRGAYLVESRCNTCHGIGRIRVPEAPDLAIAAAYDYPALKRLLTTGVPLGERELHERMVEASITRYVYMPESDIEALYAYFSATYRPDRIADAD